MEEIRNFCIIAHIDHGKSTLADRLLELTETVDKRQMREQILDQMDLEREKGITIKLQPVRMKYQGYELNLIDTPGHVDFSYEVSRSLTAVEGALLIVDATQGIQAQTLSNVYLAIEAGLEIIPVLNKIDLPAAQPEKITQDMVKLLGCEHKDVLRISAKTGEGVDKVLEAIVQKVPAPKGSDSSPLRALIFDSIYDEYRGVILYARIFDGKVKAGDEATLMASKKDTEINEVGLFAPQQKPQDSLRAGEIGYIVTNLKSVASARVGDTVTLRRRLAEQALPGYKEVKPFVYAGFFPSSGEQYETLKNALEKLQLNDASLKYTPENSQVLGFGFRIGFLGLLHLEIIKERLEREFELDLVVTNPSTDYEITTVEDEKQVIRSASELPDPTKITEIKEPWIKGEIVVPKDYLGNVIQLINSVRGQQNNIGYLDEGMSLVSFEAPLANVLTDFYDNLKSITSGYGSFNYELVGYRAGNLVKVDILVAGNIVDSLSQIMHKDEAQARARETVAKLKDVIPRQLFEVSLQAAIGGKIIAREDVKALGKNVTGHLYGGDISRKKKLWSKQKEGKKRMKKFGNVEIPPEAFTVMLKKD